MSEDTEYRGVRTNHPSIVKFLEQCAKDGKPKEVAARLSGMPAEVVDREYAKVKDKK